MKMVLIVIIFKIPKISLFKSLSGFYLFKIILFRFILPRTASVQT